MLLLLGLWLPEAVASAKHTIHPEHAAGWALAAAGRTLVATLGRSTPFDPQGAPNIRVRQDMAHLYEVGPRVDSHYRLCCEPDAWGDC